MAFSKMNMAVRLFGGFRRAIMSLRATEGFANARLTHSTSATAAAVILLGAACAAQAGGLVPVTADQQAAFGIRLEAPISAGEALGRRYPAEVTIPNPQLRVVSAPQSGMLEALLAAEGEQVTEGQPLALLRSTELLDAQGDYLESVTRLGLAGSQLERDRTLHKEGIIAERRLLESRAAYQELSTTVEQRRQRLELAGMGDQAIDALKSTRRLSSTVEVRAPLAGVVLEQMVSTGQAVALATPLYRVAQLDPLWLEVHVPVNRLGGIREGDRVVLPAEAIEGRVIAIGRRVHEADQGVLVRAEVHEESGRLRPGQFVEVQLAETTGGQGWRVADSALVRNAGAAFVFVAREGGFEALPVEILAQEERSLVVSGALAGTDRLAVSGVVALKAAWLGGAE